MKLYGYWRSSAAYRVRIAMHLKGLEFESIPVHLVKDGGEQHKTTYTEINPTHLVPTLVDGDVILHQSIAIIEYLDEKYPQADICLVPQVYNAYRFNLDMSEFPNIRRVVENCNLHVGFIAALPENQADAQY
jgi:glutathione S-transferase